MSQRGRLIFVCFLIGAACVLLQMQCGKPANAAFQGEAATQTPAAGKHPCLNVAARAKDVRFCGGLRNAPDEGRLNAGQLNQVLLSLREKTGWQSLEFDEEGFLVCPDPHVFSGGSAAARRLLSETIFGDDAYHLEAHKRSPAVIFARLATGTNYESHLTGAKINARLLQIDFADFHQLRGEEPALRAFDLGVAILHELAHGVWHLRDAASGEKGLGECETFINQIRRELRLPERQSYIAHVRPSTHIYKRPIAELHFTRISEKQGQARRERFLLRWEAEMVGAVINFRRSTLVGRGEMDE